MKALGIVGIAMVFIGAASMDSEGIGLVIAITLMVSGMAFCTICGIAMTEPDDDVDKLIGERKRMKIKDKDWKQVSKTVYTDAPPCLRQEIEYKNRKYPDWVIMAKKYIVLHASGKGHRTVTEYIAEDPSGDYPFYKLKDAQEFIEKTAGV